MLSGSDVRFLHRDKSNDVRPVKFPMLSGSDVSLSHPNNVSFPMLSGGDARL